MKFPATTKTHLKRILSAIRNPKNKTFLLSTHVNPDPDALCSQLAMGLALKSFGKTVLFVNHEDVPSRLKFLPQSHLIKSVKSVVHTDYDVAVILDCGDLDRVGRVKNILKPDKPLINVDHHITNDGFGDHHWIDPQSSSTCELLFDLFALIKVGITKPIAHLLYAGIMGDTGGFRYDNTTPKTHRIAARLQEFDLSPADYYRKLYESIAVGDLQKFIRVMGRAEFERGGKIVSLSFSERLFKSFSEDFDLKEAIFRFLRSIKDVEVAVIFTAVNGKKVRVNLRSAGQVDVAKISAFFKGGGHRNASGCTLENVSLPEAKHRVIAHIKKVFTA